LSPRQRPSAAPAATALHFVEALQGDYRRYRPHRRVARGALCCAVHPILLGHPQPRHYHRSMTPLTPPPRVKPLWRALVEVAFIVFLFYSNLLMGEFTGVNGQNKTFAFALRDIITPTNFLIAIVSAFIGYGIFEFLRKKL
jgi:hypothetical protein